MVEPTEVLAALEGYRNSDGGYGWGLEPDLRSPESQPAGALHALEVFAEVGPVSSARAVAVCDWLTTATLDDGGLPFALPVTDPAGCAPFWANADCDVVVVAHHVGGVLDGPSGRSSGPRGRRPPMAGNGDAVLPRCHRPHRPSHPTPSS